MAEPDKADKPAKRKPGRPATFSMDKLSLAQRLCHTLGATDMEIAQFVGVTVKTINQWKLEHPEFGASLKIGKDLADARVEKSLYHKAIGYSHESVKFHVVGDKVVETPYIEHIPPSDTAMIFWLKNRQSKNWRDRSEVDTHITYEVAAPEQLARAFLAMLAENSTKAPITIEHEREASPAIQEPLKASTD